MIRYISSRTAGMFIAIGLTALLTAGLSAQSRGRNPFPFKLGKVHGFADYHAHQVSDRGFGGRLIWGNHTGPEKSALRPCTGKNHALSWLPVADDLVGQPDLGSHRFKRHGWHSRTGKRYTDWPVWQTTTHQGYWEGWLKQAHTDGMRMFVASVGNMDMFCNIMPRRNTSPAVLADLLRNPQDIPRQCNDFVNLKRQIRAIKAFDKKHSWYEVAYSPADARRIMNQGKLAVVIAIESSKMWGPIRHQSWSQVKKRLDEFQNLGVRSFQLVHMLDNNIGGPAAFAGGPFGLMTFIDKMFNYGPRVLLGDIQALKKISGFRQDHRKHNYRGLTAVGKRLVDELMRRKMIVDIAHLSERGIDQVYAISKRHRYYPLFQSHGHLREIYNAKHADEYKTGVKTIRKIKQTGGVYGVRPGALRVKTYRYSGVANNCHGSSRSFAQSYMLLANGYRVKFGIGMDMSSMIASARPRFYDSRSKWGGKIGKNAPVTWACGGGVDKDDRERGKRAQGNRNSRGLRNDFDLIGMAHIGHLKNLLRDLNKLGVQTHHMNEAAENFTVMWERIHSSNRRPLSSYASTHGIDHLSYVEYCPRLVPIVGRRRAQVGVYLQSSDYRGYGIPEYVPICKAKHIFGDVQERNCRSYGFKHGSWCIKKRGKGKWYSARKITRNKCPFPKIYARTHSNGKIICKPTPHFKIKSNKCRKKGGTSWGGYCLWNGGSYWYKGRKLK